MKPREKNDKILEMLADGFSQAEIAEELNLTQNMIEKRINSMKKQYGAKTLFQLAVIIFGKKL